MTAIFPAFLSALLRPLALVLAALVGLVAPAMAQDYRIGTGDQLNIEVLEDASLNRTVVVLPGGTITFPYAGSVRAAGRTPAQVQEVIAAAISSVLAAPPTVFVSVVPREPEPRGPAAPPAPPPTLDIYVMGEVGAPGLKSVAPGTTFLQALSQAGGLGKFAAPKRVQLRRPGTPPQLLVINYDALMDGAAMSVDPQLVEGDVILVPERKLFE